MKITKVHGKSLIKNVRNCGKSISLTETFSSLRQNVFCNFSSVEVVLRAKFMNANQVRPRSRMKRFFTMAMSKLQSDEK